MSDGVQVYDGDGEPRGRDPFLEYFSNPIHTMEPIELRGRLPDRPPEGRDGLPFDLVLEVEERIARNDANALRMVMKLGRFALIPRLTIHCEFGFNDHVFSDLVAMEFGETNLKPVKDRNGSPISMLRLEMMVRWRKLDVVDTY